MRINDVFTISNLAFLAILTTVRFAQRVARAKAITHACETRFRGQVARHGMRCKDISLRGSAPRLYPDVVERLLLRDRMLLKNAVRSGHTHVQTIQAAVCVKTGRDGRP